MTTGSKYATGDVAWGLCKKCGLRFLLRELCFDGYYPGLRVCTDCYDDRQPQEFLVDVTDPTALWKPSPEWGPVNPVLDGDLAGTTAELSWTEAKPRGGSRVDSYILYRAFSDDGVNYTVAILIVDLPVTYYTDLADLVENGNPKYDNEGIELEFLSYDDPGLTPGFWRYQVFARLDSGRLANSNLITLNIAPIGFNLGTSQSDAASGTDVLNTNSLGWDDVSADHYDVYRQINSGGYTLLTTTSGATVNYDDTGNLNTWVFGQYDYYVIARDSGNANIGTSNVSSQTWVANVLNQDAIQQEETTIGPDLYNVNALTWEWDPATPDIIDHHDIYRQINGGGYTLLTTVGAFITDYADQGLASSWVFGQYDYYIVGLTATNGILGTSNVQSTTWVAPPTLVLDAIVKTSPGSDNQNALTWNDVSADHYDIWRQINGGGSAFLATVSGASFDYNDIGLTSTWIAGEYDYFVLAKDGSNNTLQTSNTQSTTWAVPHTVITIAPGNNSQSVFGTNPPTGDQQGWSTSTSGQSWPIVNTVGAVTPDPALLGGIEMGVLEFISATPTHKIAVMMIGTLAQNFFTQLQFTDRLTAVETYLTSAATYDVSTYPGYTLWTWTATLNTPFTGLVSVPVTFT